MTRRRVNMNALPAVLDGWGIVSPRHKEQEDIIPLVLSRCLRPNGANAMRKVRNEKAAPYHRHAATCATILLSAAIVR